MFVGQAINSEFSFLNGKYALEDSIIGFDFPLFFNSKESCQRYRYLKYQVILFHQYQFFVSHELF